jgi:pyruvate dehydrogenase complex dehydrogenase (E1) component
LAAECKQAERPPFSLFGKVAALEEGDVMNDQNLEELPINTIRTLPMARIIGMHTFGASAPLKELQKRFGFEPNQVVTAAKEQLAINR